MAQITDHNQPASYLPSPMCAWCIRAGPRAAAGAETELVTHRVFGRRRRANADAVTFVVTGTGPDA